MGCPTHDFAAAATVTMTHDDEHHAPAAPDQHILCQLACAATVGVAAPASAVLEQASVGPVRCAPAAPACPLGTGIAPEPFPPRLSRIA